VPLLLKAAADDDVTVRWTAVNSLQHLANENCVPILQLCLEDETHPSWEEQRICDIAAATLKRIGTPEAQVALSNWRPG
ncbi:MAG: HEAT repeat domain-containing protein, partial [Chloroflexota bacterium]